MFLSLLLLVVQVLAGLLASTVVEAATYDAARLVAEGGGGAAARSHVTELLGPDAAVAVTVGPASVRVEVRVRGPVLSSLPVAAPFTTITKVAEVRREERR